MHGTRTDKNAKRHGHNVSKLQNNAWNKCTGQNQKMLGINETCTSMLPGLLELVGSILIEKQTTNNNFSE